MLLPFKVILLLFIVILASNIAIAGSSTENSISYNLQNEKTKNETVYIESGFSGMVTIKDTLLNKTTDVKVNYKPSSSGSGLIVTKNGYIITAFHVVSDSDALDHAVLKKMEDEDIRRYVEKEALDEYTTKNPQISYKLLKNRPKSKNDLKSDEDIDYITDEFIKNGWISAKSYEYNIYVKGPSLNENKNPLKARLVDFGDPKTDKDIALMKIDPEFENLPVSNISSKNQEINKNVRIYGYPSNKIENLRNQNRDKNKLANSRSSYMPSSVSGRLTGKMPNSQGTIYYKTNAATVEGYSGGPVVDDKNRVIGILIYGIDEEEGFKNGKSKKKRSNKEIGNSSLFLSSDYIIEICNKNKVAINVD